MRSHPFARAHHASRQKWQLPLVHLIAVCGSSSKETLINVKAKLAALKQKIKFSDAIDEQQKGLKKKTTRIERKHSGRNRLRGSITNGWTSVRAWRYRITKRNTRTVNWSFYEQYGSPSHASNHNKLIEANYRYILRWHKASLSILLLANGPNSSGEQSSRKEREPKINIANSLQKIGSLWLHVPSDMKNGIIRNDYTIQQQRVTDMSYSGFCWPKRRVGDTSWHITRAASITVHTYAR